MFPVERAEHRAKVLAALQAMFDDNVKSRWLGADGTYHRRARAQDDRALRAQVWLQEQVLSRQRRAAEGAGVAFVPQQRREPTGA